MLYNCITNLMNSFSRWNLKMASVRPKHVVSNFFISWFLIITSIRKLLVMLLTASPYWHLGLLSGEVLKWKLKNRIFQFYIDIDVLFTRIVFHVHFTSHGSFSLSNHISCRTFISGFHTSPKAGKTIFLTGTESRWGACSCQNCSINTDYVFL